MWRRKKTSLILTLLLILLAATELFAQLPSENQGKYVFSPDGRYLLRVRDHAGRSMVSLIETEKMKELSKWELPNFNAHSIQFGETDSNRLLLASKDKIMVYQLSQGKQKLLYTQPKGKNKSITAAKFSQDDQEITWTSEDSLFSSDLVEKKPNKITELKDGKINSLTNLKDKRTILGQEGKKELTLIPRADPNAKSELKGHQKKVVGTASPEGESLYSLDENDSLVRWDLLKKEIATEQQLHPKQELTPQAIAIDDQKKNLLILYKDKDGKKVGKKVSLKSIENLNPTSEDAPLVQKDNKIFLAFDGLFEEDRELLDALDQIEPKLPLEAKEDKQPNTKLMLAQIEADNQNYSAALDYIREVPPESEDYQASRELQRKIYDQIDLENNLKSAVDQYEQGNYESAKILLESLDAKHPGQKKVLRYKQMTEDQLSKEFWKTLLTALLILLALLLLFLAAKRMQQKGATITIKDWTKPDPGNALEALRKKYIHSINQTKTQLAEAIHKDIKKLAGGNWKKISEGLGKVEKAARAATPPYEKMIKVLEQLQQDISLTLGKLDQLRHQKTEEAKQKAHAEAQAKEEAKAKQEAARKKQEQEEAKKQRQRQEETQKKQEQEQKAKQEQAEEPKRPKEPDPSNYYEILGIGPDASPDEIKKAYRAKVKEYHPDRHSSSDFDWIKEEANRLTRLVGEAYEVLQNPRTRAEFDRKLREKNNR